MRARRPHHGRETGRAMGLRTVARVSFTQAIIGSFRSLYPLLPVEGLGPLLSAGDFGPLLWTETET